MCARCIFLKVQPHANCSRDYLALGLLVPCGEAGLAPTTTGRSVSGGRWAP